MPAKKQASSKSKSSGKAKKVKSTETTAEVVAPVVNEPVVTEIASAVSESDDVVVSEPVVVAEDSTLSLIESDFASLTTRLAELKSLYTSITTDIRKLHKNMQKHLRETSKKQKKKNTKNPKVKRAPSGFAKPAVISNELCDFLKKPYGAEMARTEVTKQLTEYIKKHKLQDPSNKRKILPDKNLKKLLNVSNGDEVTYFNLQKYMKVHFPQSQKSLAAAASSTA